MEISGKLVLYLVEDPLTGLFYQFTNVNISGFIVEWRKKYP